MKTLKDAIEIILGEPPEAHYPSYYASLLRKADVPDKDAGECSEIPNGSDVISRQQAIKAIEESKIEVWLNHYDRDDGYNEGLETALEEIKDLPSAEPEQKIGYWIPVHPLQTDDEGTYFCSNCKTGDWDIKPTDKFCKFCGAKMQGVKKE